MASDDDREVGRYASDRERKHRHRHRHRRSRSRSPTSRYRRCSRSRSPRGMSRRSRSRSPRGGSRRRSRSRSPRRSSSRHYSRSRSRSRSPQQNDGKDKAGIQDDLMAQLQAKARVAAQQAKKELVRPELPSYIKPGAVNVRDFATKERKKKLLWKNKSAVVHQTGGESHNQWEGVAFEGNDADAKRNKFLKLMGAGKKKAEEKGAANQTAAPLLQNLEQQFHTGLAYTFDGKKKGLGFGTR